MGKFYTFYLFLSILVCSYLTPSYANEKFYEKNFTIQTANAIKKYIDANKDKACENIKNNKKTDAHLSQKEFLNLLYWTSKKIKEIPNFPQVEQFQLCHELLKALPQKSEEYNLNSIYNKVRVALRTKDMMNIFNETEELEEEVCSHSSSAQIEQGYFKEIKRVSDRYAQVATELDNLLKDIPANDAETKKELTKWKKNLRKIFLYVDGIKDEKGYNPESEIYKNKKEEEILLKKLEEELRIVQELIIVKKEKKAPLHLELANEEGYDPSMEMDGEKSDEGKHLKDILQLLGELKKLNKTLL